MTILSYVLSKAGKEFVKMLESRFKTKLIKEIKQLFPGCLIFHLDPNEVQGISDLLILWGPKWAVLEGKKTSKSSKRPNQEYYVNMMNAMSFAAFICPENKEEVLYGLQQAFRT